MTTTSTNKKFPAILGISGKKYSGKSSVAKIIKEEILPNKKVAIMSFADSLKGECVLAIRTVLKDFNYEELEANKETYRGLLQWWGTDFRRKLFGKDYWVNTIEKVIEKYNYEADLIIIPDVRFANEFEWIKEVHGGQVIYIDRIFNPKSKGDSHISENLFDMVYFRQRCITLENAFSLGMLPSLVNKLWNQEQLSRKLNLEV